MQKRLQEILNGENEHYILPFFWQHGETPDLLLEGMQKIYECGIRQICIESRTHPDFLGPGWWRDLNLMLEYAKQHNMKIWILDDSHFPTGRCADTITDDSPYRKFVLTRSCIDVVGPMRCASFFSDLKETEQIISVIAAKRSRTSPHYLTQLTDISSFCYNGVVEWDVPDGLWTVIIIKSTDHHTALPNFANLIDRSAVRYFLDTVYEPHYKHYGAEFGTCIAGFFSDEPQIGNTFKDIDDPDQSRPGNPQAALPWCEELQKTLQEKWNEQYPYYLTALWYDIDSDANISNLTGLARRDFMDAVTHLYQKNFCEQIGKWCEQHRVEYIGHIIEGARLGTGVGHYFRGLWGQHMAGIDVVLQSIRPELDDIPFHRAGGKGGQIPQGTPFNHYALAKLCSSLSHIDPKKQGRAMCEIFGAYGWVEGVKLMKWLVDHMLVRGINYFVPHAFTMKDFPDDDCPPHFYARGNNPQFQHFGNLMRYTNRVCHLINGGTHNVDVGILYSSDLEWMNYENSMPFYLPAMHLTKNQVDFDVLPLDFVLGAEIKGGKLVCSSCKAGQEAISVLVIPACYCVTRIFADWCIRAQSQGLSLIFLETLPLILEADGTLTAWASQPGRILEIDKLATALRQEGYGLNVSNVHPYLRYYSYSHSDGTFYLFFNESTSSTIQAQLPLEFAQNSGLYEYDAWNNCLHSIACHPDNGNILLELLPYQLKIVYVGQADSKNILPEKPEIQQKQPLQLNWKVFFKKAGSSEFEFESEISCLKNVTSHDWSPTFSGTIRYEAEFVLNDSIDWQGIDLGDVYETATVLVNGVNAGTCIVPPYRFDIQGLLHSGNNQIVIDVTNTLVHQIPDFFSIHMPIEPSGMLGPVELYR